MNEQLRQSVIALMDRHGIGEFVYSGPDGHLGISDDDLPDLHPEVLADGPGIFLAAHPATPADSTWPRRVREGEIIGYLKISPLLRPVYARQDAVLPRPQLADGSLAGYGQRLF